MINEPLDFRRALKLAGRYKIVMAGAAILGLLGGVGWAMLQPPVLVSEAWVQVPPMRGGTATQVLIAGSDPVLKAAQPSIRPSMSIEALRNNVHVTGLTPAIIAVVAKARDAAQAENAANAVADSFVEYVNHRGNVPGGPVQASMLQAATPATGTKKSSRVIAMAILGALIGAVLATLGVFAVSRRDRRLRERDSIADSIGVPVLASVNVDHPSDAAGWRKLLEEYRPGAVDAWRLRKALQYLGLSDLSLDGEEAGGLSLTVISPSADRGALALGPQLAVFAASRGIATRLVIDPQADVSATATLRAACTGPPAMASRLRVSVGDDADVSPETDIALTVVVAVMDSQAGELPRLMSTAATVLGVSAGAATAEQLARVAVAAGVGGHDIIGILVADPDPADSTSGRLPQVERPAQHRRPTRVTGRRMESGR